MSAYPNLLK